MTAFLRLISFPTVRNCLSGIAMTSELWPFVVRPTRRSARITLTATISHTTQTCGVGQRGAAPGRIMIATWTDGKTTKRKVGLTRLHAGERGTHLIGQNVLTTRGRGLS